jgi:hypothetical protein
MNFKQNDKAGVTVDRNDAPRACRGIADAIRAADEIREMYLNALTPGRAGCARRSACYFSRPMNLRRTFTARLCPR